MKKNLVDPVVERGPPHLQGLVLLLQRTQAAAKDGVAGVRWEALTPGMVWFSGKR